MKVKTTKIYNWMTILYHNDVFSNSNCLHDIEEKKHPELPYIKIIYNRQKCPEQWLMILNKQAKDTCP